MTETPGSRPVTHSPSLTAPLTEPTALIGWPSLKAERIQLALRELSGWELSDDERSIRLLLRYPEPAMALSFAGFAFTVGRRREHFPELRLIGCSLEIVVWTPEVGGVTEQDLQYARLLTPGYERPS